MLYEQWGRHEVVRVHFDNRRSWKRTVFGGVDVCAHVCVMCSVLVWGNFKTTEERYRTSSWMYCFGSQTSDVWYINMICKTLNCYYFSGSLSTTCIYILKLIWAYVLIETKGKIIEWETSGIYEHINYLTYNM